MRRLNEHRLRTMQDTSLAHRAAPGTRRPQHEAGLARSITAPAPSSWLGAARGKEQSPNNVNSHPRTSSVWEEDTALDPATLEWLGAEEFPKPAWGYRQVRIIFLPIVSDAPLDASTVDWLQTQEFPSRALLYEHQSYVQGTHCQTPVPQYLGQLTSNPLARTCVAGRRSGSSLTALCDVSIQQPVTEKETFCVK